MPVRQDSEEQRESVKRAAICENTAPRKTAGLQAARRIGALLNRLVWWYVTEALNASEDYPDSLTATESSHRPSLPAKLGLLKLVQMHYGRIRKRLHLNALDLLLRFQVHRILAIAPFAGQRGVWS